MKKMKKFVALAAVASLAAATFAGCGKSEGMVHQTPAQMFGNW